MNGKHPSLDTIPVDRDRPKPGGYALLLMNDLGFRVVTLPAAGSVVIARIETYGLAWPLMPRSAP